jgi:hypothetical protein
MHDRLTSLRPRCGGCAAVRRITNRRITQASDFIRQAAVARRFACGGCGGSHKSLKSLLRRLCGGAAAVSPIPPIAPCGALRARAGAAEGVLATPIGVGRGVSPPGPSAGPQPLTHKRAEKILGGKCLINWRFSGKLSKANQTAIPQFIFRAIVDGGRLFRARCTG